MTIFTDTSAEFPDFFRKSSQSKSRSKNEVFETTKSERAVDTGPYKAAAAIVTDVVRDGVRETVSRKAAPDVEKIHNLRLQRRYSFIFMFIPII